MDKLNKENICMDNFEMLLQPIYEKLYRYIYSMVRNKSQTEDVLQNTLINAFRNLHQLRDINKFKYWIFTIARREVINALPKYNKEISMDISECLKPQDDKSKSPDEYIIDKEFKQSLAEAINELNSDDREIIILRYYAGLRLKEISDILHINENTVRTKHRNSKNKLYKILESKGLIY